MRKVDLPGTEDIYEILMKETDARFKHFEKFVFARHPYPVLEEIRFEQVKKILRIQIAVDTNSVKDKNLQQLFYSPFHEGC